MTQPGSIQSSLPEDIALKIASCLQVGDLCALGSCCRFWRELCLSDYLWERLARERWPSLDLFSEFSSVGGKTRAELNDDDNEDPSPKGWKGFYLKWHNEMAGRAISVIQYIEQRSLFNSVEIGDYLKAIEALNSLQLGFQDVKLFLFKPNINVLLNLVGLHYCIHRLDVPVEQVEEALRNSMISHRQVCVKWWKLGRLFYGFRMRDESHSRSVSLQDLTSSPGNEILSVLHRGAIHEVFRVQISIYTPACTSWSSQSSQVSD